MLARTAWTLGTPAVLCVGCACKPERVDAALDGGLRDMPECVAGQVLESGASCRFAVQARLAENPLPIKAQPGERYALHLPAGQSWTDWFISSDPGEGHGGNAVMNLMKSRKRLPEAPWFSLVVAERLCSGGEETCQDHLAVHMSGEAHLVMPQRGRVVFFANDVPGFYWNNCGRVWLRIQRR